MNTHTSITDHDENDNENMANEQSNSVIQNKHTKQCHLHNP